MLVAGVLRKQIAGEGLVKNRLAQVRSTEKLIGEGALGLPDARHLVANRFCDGALFSQWRNRYRHRAQ